MVTFISDGVVSEMRTLEEAGMPETFTLSTPGEASADEFGGWAEGDSATSTVRGRVRKAKGTETVLGGQVVEFGSPILGFPARTVIPADATLVKAARDGDVERSYRVVSPLDGGTYETALEVLATEV